jgi:ABC-type multidrug transport system ATPase subunit
MDITVAKLNKRYGANEALKEVSFKLSGKGLYLLAGPNGSGKTTLMEIMTQMIPATSGSITYSDNITGTRFKERVGILFQQNGVRKNVTVTEELRFISEVFNKKIDIDVYLHKFGLYEHRNKKAQRLSGGLQRKLLVASIFMQDYDVVFFDEPASGLDVQTRDFIWSIIKEYSSEKMCIVSDHYLNQAASYCDEILLLRKGVLLFKGEKDVLLNNFEFGTRVQGKKADVDKIKELLDTKGLTYEVVYTGGFGSFFVRQTLENVAGLFKDNIADVRQVTVEDVYLYLSEKEATLHV